MLSGIAIAYWIVAGAAALVFLFAGFKKLTTSKDKLVSSGEAAIENFADWQIKLIGVAEIAGALGITLPIALNIVPALSEIAGICLAVLMICAIAVHVRRKERFIPAFVLLCLVIAAVALGCHLPR